MSCSFCNNNPCTESTCDPAHEPLSSALNNFITSFYGSLIKTCINDQVVWTLPCDLNSGSPNFPRFTNEGLACYFLRYFNQIVVAPPSYGSFYAMMEPDNPNPITPGSAIDFPNNGPSINIVRSSSSSFIIPDIATYEIKFSLSSGSINQLGVRLNGIKVSNTIISQNTSGIIMSGSYFITTTSLNSIIEIVNFSPPGGDLVMLSSSTIPISAWLIIKKI